MYTHILHVNIAKQCKLVLFYFLPANRYLILFAARLAQFSSNAGTVRLSMSAHTQFTFIPVLICTSIICCPLYSLLVLNYNFTPNPFAGIQGPLHALIVGRVSLLMSSFHTFFMFPHIHVNWLCLLSFFLYSTADCAILFFPLYHAISLIRSGVSSP